MSSRNIDARTMLRRLIDEDFGQDLIEYALLGVIVGIASVLTWKAVAEAVFDVYSAADADVQGASGCTPNPGGGGCP